MAESVCSLSGRKWTKVDVQPSPTPVEPPRGFFAAHVDDKGRLKLPVNFQQFIGATGDQALFVTSVDGRIARIYPMSVWKESEKCLEELAKDDPDAADALLFMSQHYGAESRMDAQGRIVLPTEMRRELNLENEEVRVGVVMGAISIFNKSVYEQDMQRSRENLSAKIGVAKTKGFR